MTPFHTCPGKQITAIDFLIATRFIYCSLPIKDGLAASRYYQGP